MADCVYWQGIVADLRTKCSWAAHVLASDKENLVAARKCVEDDEIIENVIYAYEDESAQPYCDELLLEFDKERVERVFTRMQTDSEGLKRSVTRFLTL